MWQKVTLECITESHPNSINYWMHGNDFVQGGTYESMTMDKIFKVIMKLVIRPAVTADFGGYKCVAKNSMGQSEKLIQIHRKYLYVCFAFYLATSAILEFEKQLFLHLYFR